MKESAMKGIIMLEIEIKYVSVMTTEYKGAGAILRLGLTLMWGRDLRQIIKVICDTYNQVDVKQI